MELIVKCWSPTAPMRTLTITGMNLVPAEDVLEQLSLFDIEDKNLRKKQEKFDVLIDEIRNKFGHKSIQLAGIMIDQDEPN